ncbi:uncharacterized protein PV07_06799 [Cladophialophora immunda]|uniref:Elongator complex protein 2 n=1 Tax=Cladophialophora immunda TaxID=569365 RepID=A0A0D2C7E3_9EURO|nr:uncharacterized protein PV07_06799 [Cladophialophora immunda]KIW27018.1 hypothetical protein PV07_06799 [Cladophialophora immunda]OQU99757.1 WD domain-containing protein [Cladophialophora immunda]
MSSLFAQDEYLSVGGNRHSAAADWSITSGLLAFGADQNVGIWSPRNDSGHGISALLSGHTGKVTAVTFITPHRDGPTELLVSGSANGEIAVWRQEAEDQQRRCLMKTTAHEGAVNTVASLSQSRILATGGADAKVKLWKVQETGIEAVATLVLKPRFIPLALAIGSFPFTSSPDHAYLVAGGTRNDIQVYAIESLSSSPKFHHHATLTGHEAWVRSLALTQARDGDALLASASQDKYVRLWRFQLGGSKLTNQPAVLNGGPAASGTLSAKIQTVSAGEHKYSITFEALLLGHEDWIYSAAWSPTGSQLLTASADGSLSIWEADPSSGIWISTSRLGEIRETKGATTATGSAGGFWTGLWGPDGKTVTCVGRTGSWRLWQYDEASQFWAQRFGVSGHTNSVNGICWAPDGSYLLSTSSDQTTRLHAEWKRGEKRSWHEFSRPQIHGYDLNCIASTTPYQFSSGADEKLLRVFNEPRDIANMLHRLCQIPLPPELAQMPDTAAIPVLGLSNKAMDDREENDDDAEDETLDPAGTSNGLGTSLLDIQDPPTEDLLARHTLWPEHEKLYGHGSEISEAATPPDGSVLATACRASSLDQAVIRLYDTQDWNEIRPPLSAHALTVTRLAFSPQSAEYLLSVGRDRQWAVFKRSSETAKSWTRVAINVKAHSRMILDATWLAGHTTNPSFVTAGRDKLVKLWSRGAGNEGETNFTMRSSIARKGPVTAVSATSITASDGPRGVLAVGEDDGTISLHTVDANDELKVLHTVEVPRHFCPSKTINRLAWRPTLNDDGCDHTGQGSQLLAVASADGSVRILRIDVGRIGQ